ncbi:MAG: FG-GAP repeat domain-containing protein [Candidatus Midichloria sp.]
MSYSIGSGSYVEIVAGDFDGDNQYDVAVTSSIGVSILIGNGDGTFQAPMNYSAAEIVSHSFASGLTIGDFNKDGKPDLATINWSITSILLNITVWPTTTTEPTTTTTSLCTRLSEVKEHIFGSLKLVGHIKVNIYSKYGFGL